MVKFTITAYNDELCKKIEPNVSITSKRFRTIKKLSEQGIFTGILMWPMLPWINDNVENIKSIIKAAAENGAKFVCPYFGLTLRQNQRTYYYNQLDRLFPGLKEKYMDVYGDNYECISPNRSKLQQVLAYECEKYGLLYKMADIRGEIKSNYEHEQISFL